MPGPRARRTSRRCVPRGRAEARKARSAPRPGARRVAGAGRGGYLCGVSSGLVRAPPEDDPRGVGAAVANPRKRLDGKRRTVELDGGHSAGDTRGILDGDLIDGVSVAEHERVALPVARNAGIDLDGIASQAQPEE